MFCTLLEQNKYVELPVLVHRKVIFFCRFGEQNNCQSLISVDKTHLWWCWVIFVIPHPKWIVKKIAQYDSIYWLVFYNTTFLRKWILTWMTWSHVILFITVKSLLTGSCCLDGVIMYWPGKEIVWNIAIAWKYRCNQWEHFQQNGLTYNATFLVKKHQLYMDVI